MTSPGRAFPCSRCRQPIPIPEQVLRDPAAVLVCPHCGQRHVRKRSGAADPSRRSLDSRGVEARSASSGPQIRSRAPLAEVESPSFRRTSGSDTAAATAASSDVDFQSFQEGSLVAGRYRVLRFLARGGMGEVYEVEDLELHERLALKTVHPAVASDPGAIERFKREVHLARKVTHPNVCRLFDLGYHTPREGLEPIAFLTMEMLEGETLAARLKRLGKMSPDEILPLARQMAAGLRAAHDAGIVHRDFKADNVFLVRLPDGSERVVVTDFGIARARGSRDDLSVATLTMAGSVVGTPAYMAPEQVAGETVGAAADQYALGLVLYEMLSGELPFRGDTPLATAAKRLSEPPPSLAKLVPELPAHWVAAIGRALERRPEDRFSSVTAFLEALEKRNSASAALDSARTTALSTPRGSRGPATETPPAGLTGRPGTRRAVAFALLLLLLGVAIWAYWRVQEIRSRGEVVRPTLARKALAVLPFENLSKRQEVDWMGGAMAEMFSTELGQSREIRVVSSARVRDALESDAGLGNAPRDREARVRLRERLGSDYVLLGSYVALPESGAIRLDLWLEDLAAEETLLALAEQGTAANLFELVGAAGAKLRERLGVSSRPTSLAGLLPRTGEAARLYLQGIEAQRGGDPQRAQELLLRAVELEPDNALAHAALAASWSALGFEQRARQATERALELAKNLPESERLAIEARDAELRGDWGRAAAIWRALWQSAPDVPDFGLALARAELAAGRSRRALEVLEELRRLPGVPGDPRTDLQEAEVAAALGEHRRQQEAAERAIRSALEKGSRRLEGEARLQLAWALRQLGAPERALEEATRAGEIAEGLGDLALGSQAGSVRGALLLDRGDLPGAAAAYQRAVDLARNRGDRSSLAQALNNLAVVLRRRGALGQALRHYEEARAVAQEVGSRRGWAYALTNIAAVLTERGDLVRAQEHLEEASRIFRELQDVGGLASAEASLGGVLRRKGQLESAGTLLERLLAQRREAGEKTAEVGILLALGQVELDRGRMLRAEPLLEEGLALAQQLEQRASEAQARLALAEVSLARGRSKEATEFLLAAATALRSSGLPAQADRARLLLARIELTAVPESAVQVAREIVASWPPDGPVDLPLLAGLIEARAAMGNRPPEQARLVLQRFEGWSGLRRLEHELELVRGQSLLLLGRTGEARTRLEALRDLARREGYLALELEAELELLRTSSETASQTALEAATRARDAGLEMLAKALEGLAR